MVFRVQIMVDVLGDRAIIHYNETKEQSMSKASTHYLVVEPRLTFLAPAQRLTSAQYAQFLEENEGYTEGVVVTPYTQKMQRLLRKYRKMGYAQYDRFIQRQFNIVF